MMKKLFAVLLFCVLALPLPLHADDDDFNLLDDDALWNDIEAFRSNTASNQGNAAENSGAESFRLKDRSVEVGFANLEVGFPKGLLKEVFVIDLDELDKGFFMNLSLTPFYFKYSHNDDWGFRVFTGVDAFGNVTLSEKMLGFKEAVNEKSDLVAAAFAEAGADGFFHIKKFKLKAGLAGFIPFAYAYPEKINYTLRDGSLIFDYDVRVYSAITEKGFNLGKKLGLDLRLGAEYPLASFLDLGVDVANIPLIPATLTDYYQIKGEINLSGSLDELPDLEPDMDWKTGKKTIIRPLKTSVWADWRPFDTRLFSVIGAAGFQINQMYKVPFSMEGGLKARFDWANIIIVTAGARYEDRLWKNGVDIALNGRAFELDLGIDMRSPDFVESWFKSSFIGLSFGIKAGW
jgi:hypothetical protein